MKYTLKLIAEADDGIAKSAQFVIHTPKSGHFGMHASLANSFNALVTILLGEVASQFTTQEEIERAEQERFAKSVNTDEQEEGNV
jgi:hypothetical protein